MKIKNSHFQSCFLVFAVFAMVFGLGKGSAETSNKKYGPTASAVKQVKIVCPFLLRTCLDELVTGFRKTTRAPKIVVLNSNDKDMAGQTPEPVLQFTILEKFPSNKLEANSTEQRKYNFLPLGKVALAIFVSKETPLKGLTIPQVDSIFSRDRRCGFPFDIHCFGQLGLTGKWLDSEIEPLGPASFPSLARWFKRACMCNGTFKDKVKLLATKTDLFKAVSSQSRAIGFYMSTRRNKDRIKPVAISVKEGKDYFLPTPDNINSGDYPLTTTAGIRYQKAILDQKEMAFLHFCLSKKGQKILSSHGIIPRYPKGYKGKGLPAVETVTP